MNTTRMAISCGRLRPMMAVRMESWTAFGRLRGRTSVAKAERCRVQLRSAAFIRVIRNAIRQNLFGLRRFCSAGFQTCCVADFQIGRALKVRIVWGLSARLQVRKPAIQQARRPALPLGAALPRRGQRRRPEYQVNEPILTFLAQIPSH